jgi:NADH-quinone oxidoreductase subunit M
MQGPLRGDALLAAVDTATSGAAADGGGGRGAAGQGTALAAEVGARKGIRDLSGREIAVLAPMVVLIIGLGFYPKPVLDTITPSVKATISSVGEPVTAPVGVQGGK